MPMMFMRHTCVWHMLTKSSCDSFLSAIGLWASVLSMMSAKASRYAASAVAKASGLSLQYRSANFSIILSIFCASPAQMSSMLSSQNSNPLSGKISQPGQTMWLETLGNSKYNRLAQADLPVIAATA